MASCNIDVLTVVAPLSSAAYVVSCCGRTLVGIGDNLHWPTSKRHRCRIVVAIAIAIVVVIVIVGIVVFIVLFKE